MRHSPLRRQASSSCATVLAVLVALAGSAASAADAQPATSASPGRAAAPGGDAKVDAELQRFRDMLDARDPFSNPGFLFVDRGAELWAKPSGPRGVALAAVCDLGLGVGKVEGAFARLPRHFADADRVLDLEGRLLWCMTTLQARTAADILKTKFSTPERASELEDLTAFVASKSNGEALAPPFGHRSEHASRALGEAIFFRRQGPWDFSCATCHGEPGKRIRLQALPAFDVPREAREVMGSWPAYRVSQNTLRTMQHRIFDCFWQMRLPAIDYASDVTIALTSYLAAKGAGGIIAVPSIKR